MRKVFLATCVAVAVIFTAAVGLCMRVLVSPRAVASVGNAFCVVVDAGHGGIDGGVVGKTTGVRESDVNLAVAYCLKDALEEMGFEVVLTRKTEAGLYGTTAKGFKRRDMQKRREIIENADPAMVISLHQNFYPTKNTRGGQVFYRKENAGGKRLALLLQARINGLYQTEGARGRSAASGQFFMLECADCPSVLVECGFLSNREDERLLMDEGWRKRLSGAIADGVMEYFSDLSA